MKDTLVHLCSEHPEYYLLLLILLALVAVLSYFQLKKDAFDFRDILVERNGKVSLNKLGQLIALILSSWGFVYIIIHNQLTEWYFLVYMSVWTGSAALNKWLIAKAQGPSNSNQYQGQKLSYNEYNLRGNQEIDNPDSQDRIS